MISKATGVVKILLVKLEALFGKLASKVLDLVKDLLSFVLKILKLPIDYVLSHFLEPIINIVIRRIIVPDLLKNGLISIPINKQDDKLIFDIRLPAMPDYTSESVDLGFNAGFMTQFRGQEIAYPADAMHFTDREGILFQMLVNEYTVASLIDTIINLNVAHLQMDGSLINKLAP